LKGVLFGSRHFFMASLFLVPLVALALFHYGAGMLPSIGGKRPANVVTFLELALVITPNVALVSLMGFNEFSLCGGFMGSAHADQSW
jgi:hypothetical protein